MRNLKGRVMDLEQRMNPPQPKKWHRVIVDIGNTRGSCDCALRGRTWPARRRRLYHSPCDRGGVSCSHDVARRSFDHIRVGLSSGPLRSPTRLRLPIGSIAGGSRGILGGVRRVHGRA